MLVVVSLCVIPEQVVSTAHMFERGSVRGEPETAWRVARASATRHGPFEFSCGDDRDALRRFVFLKPTSASRWPKQGTVAVHRGSPFLARTTAGSRDPRGPTNPAVALQRDGGNFVVAQAVACEDLHDPRDVILSGADRLALGIKDGDDVPLCATMVFVPTTCGLSRRCSTVRVVVVPGDVDVNIVKRGTQVRTLVRSGDQFVGRVGRTHTSPPQLATVLWAEAGVAGSAASDAALTRFHALYLCGPEDLDAEDVIRNM